MDFLRLTSAVLCYLALTGFISPLPPDSVQDWKVPLFIIPSSQISAPKSIEMNRTFEVCGRDIIANADIKVLLSSKNPAHAWEIYSTGQSKSDSKGDFSVKLTLSDSMIKERGLSLPINGELFYLHVYVESGRARTILPVTVQL